MMSKVNFLRISGVTQGNREYECHGQVSFQLFGTLPAIVITKKRSRNYEIIFFKSRNFSTILRGSK